MNRFIKRDEIESEEVVGEAASVNLNVVEEWIKAKRPPIRENYEDNDMFNADETGMFLT